MRDILILLFLSTDYIMKFEEATHHQPGSHLEAKLEASNEANAELTSLSDSKAIADQHIPGPQTANPAEPEKKSVEDKK